MRWQICFGFYSAADPMGINLTEYSIEDIVVGWEIEYTDEFGAWWDDLNVGEQEDVGAVVDLLDMYGPQLPYPYSSGIDSSRHSHMRELRPQHRGKPYRVLYAFDPRRVALLLIGGDKTGDERWYEKNVPIADRLYDEHLRQLEREVRGESDRSVES